MLRLVSYIVFILMFIAIPVIAQDDEIIQAEYNTIYTVDYPSDGGQTFLQFEGKAGDVIYLLAGEMEVIFGAEIVLDLRDSVGRSIGTQYEYAFEPFVIAQLEADGVYTAVVTFTTDEPSPVEILIGKTKYIAEEGATVTFTDKNFALMALVAVEESGVYDISYTRIEGDWSPSIILLDFSERFTERTLDISGVELVEWNVAVHLESDRVYVVLISNEFSTFHTPYGFDGEAKIGLVVQPHETE